ncbi:MAG: hypothetical protein ABSG94_00025 [Brevinematales bacterium]
MSVTSNWSVGGNNNFLFQALSLGVYNLTLVEWDSGGKTNTASASLNIQGGVDYSISIILGGQITIGVLSGTEVSLVQTDTSTAIASGGSFNMDNVPANIRGNALTFTISNNSTGILNIGAIVNTNTADYTVSAVGNSTVPVGGTTTFTVTFSSASVLGDVESTLITISNNFNTAYIFSLSTTAKQQLIQNYTAAGNYSFTLNTFTYATASIKVIGGGGAGGNGLGSSPNGGGGGGGGAGQVVSDNIAVGPGYTFSMTVGSGGVNDGNGSASVLTLQGSVITANFGYAGGNATEKVITYPASTTYYAGGGGTGYPNGGAGVNWGGGNGGNNGSGFGSGGNGGTAGMGNSSGGSAGAVEFTFIGFTK